MKPTPALLAAVLAASLAGAALLTACSSNKPTREQREQLVDLHTEMALGYYTMGELDRAEGQALKGLEMAPDDDMLQLVLAWTLQRKGSTQDVLRAGAIFERLAKSDDYRAVLGLAQALERKGQAFQEAADALRSGQRDTPAGDPHARAAELERQASESWTRSVTSYERTLVLHPEDRDALNGLQRVHALLGHYEESLARSTELIELIDAELSFWEVRLQRADLTASEEQRFLKLVSDGRALQLSSYLQQATVLHALGRGEREVERLTRALELDPTRPDVYGRRAQARMDLGDYDGAIRDIDEFLRLTPESFDHPDTRLAYELRTTCEEHLTDAR